MGDGAVIHVAAGAIVRAADPLVFAATGDKPAALFTRSLVVIEKGARAMLVESHEGAAGRDYQVNTALELSVADEAHVDHIKITREGAKALHLSSLMADIGAHARFNTLRCSRPAARWCAISCSCASAARARSPTSAARACSRASSMPTSRWSSITLRSSCQSREVFKTVLDDESRGIFQGKIIVRPGAQKTDAKMASHALMLSEDAEADNKPELEIYADDVQCGHGATAGDLDEDLLFYLRARGIPREGGRGAADPGLRRRCDRRHRACGPARGADRGGRRLGQGARLTMHPAVNNGSYDVEEIRKDFPALAMQVYGKPLVYLDNAASAQKPQARCSTGCHQAYTSEYANVHRGLHYLANAATEGYEGAREKVRGIPEREAARKRSSSPATPPRRSTSSPIRSRASASSPATRSSSRSWSTTPTSCRGISCASATAR